MKRILLLFVALMFLAGLNALYAQVDFLNPYTPDEHTVLLLHFDGDLSDASGQTAGGTGYGDYSFVPGLANFDKCLYLNNSAISDSSRVLVPDTAALDLQGSFTLEAWVYFLTFGEGWSDWRGAPRILAKPYAVNSSYPNSWWFPNYWLMGDSYNDTYIFGGGFMGINPQDSSWVFNGDLRLDFNFVETMKWYHIAFIYNHDVYPRTEQLLIHDKDGNLLVMLHRTIEDTSYVIATSDWPLHIGEGGGGGNSWLDGFIDEVRISNIAREFSIPPIITGTTVPENTTDSEGPYEVKTIVTDADGLKSVVLKYNVGQDWIDLPMTNTVGDTFVAYIPGQQPGTSIKFYIEATDNNDQVAVDPLKAPEEYYSFAIIVEKALVFYLDFEEGSGQPIDKSPYATTCTINGDVSYVSDAVSGQYAAKFNPDGNGYITADPTPFMDCYEFTVEMWIKPNKLEQNLRLIIKEGSPTWYMPNYEIKGTASGQIEVGSYCDPGGWNNFTSDTALTMGSWYHLAYVFKDTVATLYILDAEDKIIEKVSRVALGKPIYTSGALHIGHAPGDAYGPYFDGLMDEIKIYNYAKQFEYKWQPFTPDEHTVLLAHFDGDLSDASGNLPDGVASSDKVGFVQSRPGMGQALYLDNSAEGGAYVTFADTSILDLGKKFSVEACFKILSKSDSWNNNPRIWSKCGDPWWTANYYGFVRADDAFLAGYYTGSAYYDNASEPGIFKPNTWYHMYFYYDEEYDYTYLVVHDTLDQIVFENTMPIGDLKDEYKTSFPLFVGFGGGGSDSYLNGYIDELRIQNYEFVTDIRDKEDMASVPVKYRLAQNYPNPFNPTTTISYQLPKTSDVDLTIYNILGEEVRVLVNSKKTAGSHSVTWDGRDRSGKILPSGVYFYRIKAGEFSAIKKMILLR
ncbi:LamG-like jellyroll fold domain-containing protein [Caldithrix abyssi]